MVTSSTPFDNIIAKEEQDFFKEEVLKENNDHSEMELWSRGDVVEATVLEVTDRDVLLDIGQKQDGRCRLDEFESKPAAGDVFQVVVQREAGSEESTQVSKREAERRIAWQTIEEAMTSKTRLTGRVTRQVNQGYMVSLGGLSLFLPQSQVDARNKLKKLKVNSDIDFRVLEVKPNRRSAIISRRAIQEEANEEAWNAFVEKYNEGDIVEGTVSRKVAFGVFIKVDEIEGLLHQTDISWKKHVQFKDKFQANQTVEVKIIGIDRENNRLSLGLKQLTEDPWVWAERELDAGDIVHGTVTSLTDYGAFVELTEGLEGLIHVSELSWSKKLRHPKRYVQENQEIDCQVLSIDTEHKRIALGLKQLKPDPWTRIGTEIKAGDVVEGPVTSITKFGAFVEVTEDVEGLIHFNDYTWDDKADRNMLKKGDIVQFKILDIDHNDRRIACGIKQLKPSPYEELQQKYKRNEVLAGKITNITDFGLFVSIGDGFEGLVHISKVNLKEGQKLSDLYSVGQEVNTVLQKIDPEAKKISLSIKAYERKKEQEVIRQYMKDDDAPSTVTLGDFMKKSLQNEEEEG